MQPPKSEAVLWAQAVLLRCGDEYVWHMPTIDGGYFYHVVERAGTALPTNHALRVWLADGWDEIEPTCPLPHHPCAECDRAILVDDYLCPECRG